jgi:hypothetical protein
MPKLGLFGRWREKPRRPRSLSADISLRTAARGGAQLNSAQLTSTRLYVLVYNAQPKLMCSLRAIKTHGAYLGTLYFHPISHHQLTLHFTGLLAAKEEEKEERKKRNNV